MSFGAESPARTAGMAVGDVITSAYGVAVLADHAVHGGSPKKDIQKRLQQFLSTHKYDPANVTTWHAEAETALLPAIIAGWNDRAKAFEKAGLSKQPGSFQ